MTELYEKSINTLELPAVLEKLADCASSEEAKRQCMSLRPLESRWEIKRSLEETSAAVALLVTRNAPSFSGLKDVRANVTRADLGGSLSAKQLLEIAGFLACASRIEAYGSGADEHSPLLPYFGSVSPDKFLEDKISSAIITEDEIADNASGELNDIRRKMRQASARVRDSLQKIISSPSYAKVLQEPIITSRSGRFVVPVRAEYKGSLPGLVHDVSSSGATVFIEPMSVVQSNNELRELEAKEQAEIERILAELSAMCAADKELISRDYEMLVSLDVIFAKGKLSLKMDAREPSVTDKLLALKRARHPLLPQKTAVPVDINLGGDFTTLVITGPNTGGKTVSLKTAGLLSLMAMCGLHIPASEESSVPVYSEVLADIGDEQSIAQSLSTFSSHMTVIVKILEESNSNSLVLFDELGGGTDPAEGAALAISIIERVRSTGAEVMATTHYAELKSYAAVTPGVVNGSCEFDVETLRPTYRLLIGVPGKSNAFAISRRLGLPDDIITDAASRLDSSAASVEEVVSALESSRMALEQEREEISASLNAAREKAAESERIRSELSSRLEKAEASARREAQHIIDEARRESERVFAELDKIRKLEKTEKDHQRVNDARAALRREINDAEDALSSLEVLPENVGPDRPVQVGDTVKIKSMGVKAEVLSVANDGTLSLQAGIMKVNARPDEVVLVDVPKATAPKKQPSKGTTLRGSAPSEIDLRGMMSDEALLVLDRFIDTAAMAKLQQVRIIHGKGTGALRAAVQQSLKRNKLIKSYRLGIYGEGENGVTIAELK